MATSTNEWLQIYQNNLAGPPPQPTMQKWSGDSLTDATTVTTTTTNQLINRVIRPNNNIRRRSRASRRTPTTLLNTDPTNFRAMVQQFTGGGAGGGSTPFMAAVAPRQPLNSYSSTDSSGFNYYGTGTRNSVVSPPAAGGYGMELRQPQQLQYYTMAADNHGVGGGDHGFCQANFSCGSGENNNGGKNNTNMF